MESIDYESVREVLDEYGIKGKGVFPPREDAVFSKNFEQEPTQRDLDLMRIEKDGREIWEYASGYSKRNLVENAMFRYKNNIGSKLRAKIFKRQETEIKLGVHLLNQMIKLGMPDSVRIR